MDARIAIEPAGSALAARADGAETARRKEEVRRAVERSGGAIVPLADANGLVWLTKDDPEPLIAILEANPTIRWVQLPWAGVEVFARSEIFSRPVTFTSAKSAYGGQVGEHAMMLILASLRHVVEQARIRHWHETEPELLETKRVTILGAGGIAQRLIRLLGAAGCQITVLRRSGADVPGATRTLPISEIHSLLPETDVLVVALALTPQTHRVIGRVELDLLPSGAILVNVARGEHIDTAALVDALQTGHLAAAGLDVTDPEPLPSDHPLWMLDNVLITSHCADSPSYITDKIAERVADNVARFRRGEPLLGAIDPTVGY